MKMEPFLLERWLQQYDPIAKYNLAHASVTPLKLGEFYDRLDKKLEFHYGAGNGEEKLREQVAQLYSDLSKDNILITNGTTEANFITANYLFAPTDEVIVIVPTYPQVLGVVKSSGAKIKEFHVTEKNCLNPDFDQLRELVTSKTKAILFANPNNPLGYVFNESHLKSICEIAEDAQVFVWADEIFRGLEYEGLTAPSVLDLYEKTIVTSGLSKMGLAGLRVGWVASRDKKLLDNIWTVKDYTTTCNSAISEHIASLALEGDNIKTLRERCKKIAQPPLEILDEWAKHHKKILEWFKPRAGYVSFPNCKVKVDVREFCRELVEKNGVLVTPGDCFNFASHIRIGYGKIDKPTLVKSLEIIEAVSEKYL